VKEIAGASRIERVTISTQDEGRETLPMDCVIPQLGFISSLGAISRVGLDIEKGDIKVAQTMETNIPGIYARGDITTFREAQAHRGRVSARRASPSITRCTS